LTVNFNENVRLKESINKESCVNGWKEYKIDISEFEGKDIFIDFKHEFNGNEKSTAYWHNVKIIEE